MNKLEQQIQNEVTSLVNSTDWEGLNEAAKSCTVIAIDFTKGFGEWLLTNTVIADDAYHWLHLKDLQPITTDQLISLYIESLK